MRYSLSLFFALTLLSNLVYANDVVCYEPSPNLSDLADAYYDLEKTSVLTSTEKNQINALFSDLTGKWKGQGYTFECRGPDSTPTIKSDEMVVTAEIRLDSTIALLIDANKNWLEKRVKKSEHLSLLGSAPVFGLTISDDQYLVFAEKYRRMNKPIQKVNPNAPSSTLSTILNKMTDDSKTERTTTKAPEKNKSSRIVETIYSIGFENGLLIILRAYYTNGVLTGVERWNLSRD